MAEVKVNVTCPKCHQVSVVSPELLGDEVDCPRCKARFVPARPRIDQLLFVGLNGYTVALDRDTGEIVWSNKELKSGYVTLLLDGDRLVVSTNGYIFCLDPLTGRVLWNNQMRGYGTGIAHLVSVRGQSEQVALRQAAESSASDDSDGLSQSSFWKWASRLLQPTAYAKWGFQDSNGEAHVGRLLSVAFDGEGDERRHKRSLDQGARTAAQRGLRGLFHGHETAKVGHRPPLGPPGETVPNPTKD